MRDALTANTIFATVALARQASAALILVVEGEDDYFLLKQHVNDDDVLLISGSGGKRNVVRAAELADSRDVRGVRFFIDADYDRFTRPDQPYPDNVITSSGHDAVMDMVTAGSTLLDRVIDTHARGSRRNGASFETEQVRLSSYVLASAVAPLRILNERKGYGLRLRGFPFGQVRSLPVSDAELASLAVSRSGTPLNAETLAREIGDERAQIDAGVSELVGDHDMFAALSRALAEQGVTVGADALWNSFLAGLLCAHLGVTDWYQALSEWGDANSRRTFDCPCAA